MTTAILTKDLALSHRAEAKRLLNIAIGLPADISSYEIDKAVDCIITSATIEAYLLIKAEDTSSI
jgi:hypothetical protein